MKFVLYGDPRTKKNSMRIVRYGKRSGIVPSEQFKQYELDCLKQIVGKQKKRLNGKYNVQCRYHMRTKRRVDLVNLLEATCDILVAAGVLEDDNSNIVVSHDGSRVLYDKETPRVEIEIKEVK